MHPVTGAESEKQFTEMLKNLRSTLVKHLFYQKKERRREEAVLPKMRVKEIKGPLSDLIKQSQNQPEHQLLE